MRGLAATCALAGISGVLLASCNAILGIEDRPLRPDAGVTEGGPDVAGGGLDGAFDSSVDGEAGPSSAYAREVIADGPLLYLRFGETTGAIAHDEMHHTDGAYPSFGATFSVAGALAGDADGAVLLDGQSKITMPASAEFPGLTAFSVEVWLKRDPATPSLAFALDHEDWVSAERTGWDLLAGSDGVGFERYASTADHASVTTATVPASEWHHFLATWDGAVQRIFQDGKLGQESGLVDAALPTFGQPWSIGGQNCACTGNFFQGAIDELAVYGKVLGGDRVQAHLLRAAGK